MAEWQKVAKQIARDICKDNKICTCNEKDGHCVSVMTIAERLAKQGYKPPRTSKERRADFTCKDCTEWDKNECECSHWYGFKENDFCSYGTPKERGADNG